MTAKQWLDENNICEQTYYHWIKIIRQKTYEPAATSANTACVKTMRSEVAFAEIPLPAINPVSAGENGFRPDITAYCEAKRPDLRSKTVAFRF